MKRLLSIVLTAAVLIAPVNVLAHAVVTPSQTSTGKTETFILTFVSETDTPTTEIRLLVPEGLSDIILYEKNGWTVYTGIH